MTTGLHDVDAVVQVDLFTSAFCAPCHAARRVLDDAAAIVPAMRVSEIDVAADPELTEKLGIRSTPTVLIRDDAGAEVFRAAGVPRPDQLLRALVLALP
jgi:thioredoxin 1